MLQALCRIAAVAAVGALAIGCSGGATGTCAVSADCTHGQVCIDGRCVDTPDAATRSDAAVTPPDCRNGTLDGEESDTDCGGPCAPCAAGRACRSDDDCASGLCGSGTCGAPAISCTDGAQNGDESDVDCGGSCAPCAMCRACRDGKRLRVDGEHADGV